MGSNLILSEAKMLSKADEIGNKEMACSIVIYLEDCSTILPVFASYII